jgi:hypothetical protein
MAMLSGQCHKYIRYALCPICKGGGHESAVFEAERLLHTTDRSHNHTSIIALCVFVLAMLGMIVIVGAG